ncbi:NADH dehydrogenase [ubiquinone] iron-sulfur protein 5 [Athalia rosae]|uniref:NADH dehydrogenase [ubiquinone] iron-sulfur protein 5 n=1 Tax=Athalia rosae TaxID=37344 RepID=UPI0020331E38|nr:NADH dehydrogenase [ubiquinone] iron-sulfur protein 5 [Athalia rosae]
MDFTPVFRTPITDITGSLINFQQQKRCADFEMNFVECMEAYGIPRGYRKCSDLFEDLHECATHNTQQMRVNAIRDERHKQYKAGLIDKPNLPPPKEDSY